jgi:hypothetical protein
MYLGNFRVITTLSNSEYDTLEIFTTEASSITVSIQAPAIVTAGESLVLEGVIGTDVGTEDLMSYQWTSDIIDLTSQQIGVVGHFSRILVIPSSSLPLGAYIKFNLTVASSATQQIGWAEVLVYASDAPSSGTCTLTATTGTAYVDVFSLNCKGWESVAYPLTVSTWRLTSNSTTTRIPLQAAVDPLGVTEFVLPAGLHTLEVIVSDGLGNTVSTYIHDVDVFLSATYQSVLLQNPMSLVSILVEELHDTIDAHDMARQLQILPGVIDTVNTASTIAGPVKNYADHAYLARVSVRDYLVNTSLSLLRSTIPLSAFVSYVLSQISAYPAEVSPSSLAQLREYVRGLSIIATAADDNALQLHLDVINAYIVVEALSGITDEVSSIIHDAVMNLAAVSLSTVYPTQLPVEYDSQGVTLVVAKGFGTDRVWEHTGVSIFPDGVPPQNIWQASVVTWPVNLYPDASVGTYVREVSFHSSNLSTLIHTEVSLAVLGGTAVTNDTTVECRSWSSGLSAWTAGTCTLTSSTSDSIVCNCTFSSVAIVAAYILQAASGDNLSAVEGTTSGFSMLTGYQWGLIIGVGVVAIAILIVAIPLSGVRMAKQGDSALLLKSYTAMLKSDGEEPDVTIEDLSEADNLGLDLALSFSEDNADAFNGNNNDNLLSEDGELQPNSTRLSRMGVQEGATGYAVSSTTLRNTLETDYDLERKENVGPITGTALRIRAQPASTESPTNNTPNFNTASRYTLVARPKLSPSISRASAARLGFTQGDSLRAIPAAFFSPPTADPNSNTPPTD